MARNRQKTPITRNDGVFLGYESSYAPGRDGERLLEFDIPESTQSIRYRDKQHEKAHFKQPTIRRPI